ncbi:MAG: ABC transporter ATP-binding protein [Pseudomonadales bacterium]
MIELSDLRFRYPESNFELLVNALQIARGETVALVGPSGSGKTTLLNLIAGVFVPSAGRVTVAGKELSVANDAARRAYRLSHVGMVFQNFELLDYLSVLDNILLPLRIGSGQRVTDRHRQRAIDAAHQVGIADKLGRHPQQLSQGERQRVAVSRALLLEPELVLADEPTGNLDPTNKHIVLQLLLDYALNSGATLVTVTHDQALLGHFQRVVDIGSISVAGGKCAA